MTLLPDLSRMTNSMLVDDSTLDTIYDQVDEALLSGNFDDLDVWIAQESNLALPTDVLLAILTSTLPARNKLKNRAKLFRDIQDELWARGYDFNIMEGLE